MPSREDMLSTANLSAPSWAELEVVKEGKSALCCYFILLLSSEH